MPKSRKVKTKQKSPKRNFEDVGKKEESSNYFIFFAFLVLALAVFVYYNSSFGYTSPLVRNVENEESKINKENASDERNNDNTKIQSQKSKINKGFKSSHIDPLQFVDVVIDGRKLTFQKLQHNNVDSKVQIYQVDNFLTKDECDGLSRVHLHHVENANKLSPLFCFADADTMKKYLKSASIDHINLNANDFVPGTSCLNDTVSSKIKDYFGYSFSTAFYRGESKFSKIFEERLQKVSSLLPSHGGKFQITSYPKGIGYKLHTDCELERTDLRDRFATALVYLQDVRKGGETIFPKLNITVKPKQGRLIVWNNMNMEGTCDPTSVHQAANVIKGRKYILQRWYYFKNFEFLGLRPPEPQLPERRERQPRVSCDLFEEGSCRWYDEWGYDHLDEYNRVKDQLS